MRKWRQTQDYTNYSPPFQTPTKKKPHLLSPPHHTTPHPTLHFFQKEKRRSQKPSLLLSPGLSLLSTTYDIRHKAVIKMCFTRYLLRVGVVSPRHLLFLCLLPAIVLQRRSSSLSLGDAHAEAASSPTNVKPLNKTRDFFSLHSTLLLFPNTVSVSCSRP